MGDTYMYVGHDFYLFVCVRQTYLPSPTCERGIRLHRLA